MREILLFVLLRQLLAEAQHDGPPHRGFAPPRSERLAPKRHAARASLAGRRPRG